MRDASARCGCGHERLAHEHYRKGSACALCLCAGFAPPRDGLALITPRTLGTFGGGALVCGLVMLLAQWYPWAGLVLVVAGWASLWRAGVARRDAVWHEWNDER
jgi:MFS family permease